MQQKSVNFQFFNYQSETSFHLSEEAKSAAIIGLLEEKRKKKRIFRGDEEIIKYVTEFKYPLYFFPWNNNFLLLKYYSSKNKILKYGLTIDIHNFIGEIKRTSNDLNNYHEMLKENIDLFKKFKKSDNINLGYFISNNELANLLINEVEKKFDLDESTSGIILDSNESNKIEDKILEFDGIWRKSHLDLENLIHVSDLLKNEFDIITKKNDEEVNVINFQTNKKIAIYIPLLKKLIKKIEKEKKININKIEKPIQKEISNLIKEKIKLENQLRRRKLQESRFKREKLRKIEKQDKHGEKFWNEELINTKKEILSIENKYKFCDKKIQELKIQNSKQIQEMIIKYSEMINNEKQKITEIENNKNNIIKKIHINRAQLEDLTNQIIEDIIKLVNQKKIEIENLKKYIISFKSKTRTVINIPFYLAQFISKNQIRYEVLTPIQVELDNTKFSVMGKRLIGLNENLSNKLKPLSNDILNMINQDVITNIENDSSFALNMDKNAIKHNIISKNNFSINIKIGFNELVEKSLLNQNESSTILNQENKWSKYQND